MRAEKLQKFHARVLQIFHASQKNISPEFIVKNILPKNALLLNF